jgi:hypothetical protein
MIGEKRTPRRVPSHACSTPGCSHAVPYGNAKCRACRIARNRERRSDDDRPSPEQRGYDEVHRRLRLLAFERDAWRCVDCGWEPDCVRDSRLYGLDQPPTEMILEELRRRKARYERHLHGEHEVPIQDRPDLRLDLSNYRTRCNVCHSAKTMRETAGRGVAVSAVVTTT